MSTDTLRLTTDCNICLAIVNFIHCFLYVSLKNTMVFSFLPAGNRYVAIVHKHKSGRRLFKSSPETAHLVFQGTKHCVYSPEAQAALEPYATGRTPKAAGAAASAICTVGPVETEPCIAFRRPRRQARRGIVAPPLNLRPTAPVVGRGLEIRGIGSILARASRSVPQFKNRGGAMRYAALCRRVKFLAV